MRNSGARRPVRLLDAFEGGRRRDEAIARADRAATEGWRIALDGVIRVVALRYQEFTTNDVWIETIRQGIPGPREPRALGARIQQAKRAGLIASTGRVISSALPRQNARPLAIWRSLIWEESRG